MSKIVNLKKYDLVLTYSWYNNNNHGICGHTFEVIDYFWILKDYFDVCLLIADDISENIFIDAIKSKYNFTEDEVKIIINCTVFSLKPLAVLSSNILFTDGGVKGMKNTSLMYDNMFQFSCGNFDNKYNTLKNVYILQDHRVYEKAKVNSINYVKKILFSKLKKIKSHDERTLIYATKNCRNLSDEYYYSLLNKYEDNFLVITNTENKLSFQSDRITQIEMPVPDVFEKFNKYIYTPIERQFDCSPRFIAECQYYNIEVLYDINYVDKGLEARREDLKHIESISLNSNDEIIQILKENI